ncbi:MAG: DNA polymerase IV [Anaerolineales bacterium]
MGRTILHLDLDAFFCAVEELDNPALRGKPFAVGGKPHSRGVVSSCSYRARQFGIHSALPMWRAVRLCKDLIVVPPRFSRYREVSQQVMNRLKSLSPLMEQISIDEAFLDISDIAENAPEIAKQVQSQIRNELGLPNSVGIASNKLVAKIATEVGKQSATKGEPPNAFVFVPPGTEANFLDPLPAKLLWGVGPKTEAILANLGIHTIGDIARFPEAELIKLLGEHGRELARYAHGIDDRPIKVEHEIKSISQEVTFEQDIRDARIIKETLYSLSDKVGVRLRRYHLVGGTVKIKLRWQDFTTITRQTTLTIPTDQGNMIYQVACELFQKIPPTEKAIRLIGVGMTNLHEPILQLELWQETNEKQMKVQEVLDTLQEKYGRRMVSRGYDKLRLEK